MVKWILRVYNLRYPGNLQHLEALVERLVRHSKHRGGEDLITYVKNVRLGLNRFLSGTGINIPGLKQTSDHIPIILGELIAEIRKGPSPILLQMINTILFATRALSVGKTPDIEPIIKAPKEGIPLLEDYMSDF